LLKKLIVWLKSFWDAGETLTPTDEHRVYSYAQLQEPYRIL
jgi:hypothetical protein